MVNFAYHPYNSVFLTPFRFLFFLRGQGRTWGVPGTMNSRTGDANSVFWRGKLARGTTNNSEYSLGFNENWMFLYII